MLTIPIREVMAQQKRNDSNTLRCKILQQLCRQRSKVMHI